MSIIHRHAATEAVATTSDQAPTAFGRGALALLRYAFGFTFLWAFFDKMFALGFHTGYDQNGHLDRFGDAAWINGGSPTEGFLKFGADGPFDSFYHNIAGAAWADWLFMMGLLGIGLALTLGVAMRVAAFFGVILYLMMWSVVLPPDNNPIIDDHILGAISLVVLAALNTGDTWGLGKWWHHTKLVQDNPVLR